MIAEKKMKRKLQIVLIFTLSLVGMILLGGGWREEADE